MSNGTCFGRAGQGPLRAAAKSGTTSTRRSRPEISRIRATSSPTLQSLSRPPGAFEQWRSSVARISSSWLDARSTFATLRTTREQPEEASSRNSLRNSTSAPSLISCVSISCTIVTSPRCSTRMRFQPDRRLVSSVEECRDRRRVSPASGPSRRPQLARLGRLDCGSSSRRVAIQSSTRRCDSLSTRSNARTSSAPRAAGLAAVACARFHHRAPSGGGEKEWGTRGPSKQVLRPPVWGTTVVVPLANHQRGLAELCPIFFPLGYESTKRSTLDDWIQAVSNFPIHDDRVGTTCHLPAAERRVSALGARLRGVDGPGGLGVENGHIGIIT